MTNRVALETRSVTVTYAVIVAVTLISVDVTVRQHQTLKEKEKWRHGHLRVVGWIMLVYPLDAQYAVTIDTADD